jgi:biotin-(acetyl-CoA carboxylase) ligase
MIVLTDMGEKGPAFFGETRLRSAEPGPEIEPLADALFPGRRLEGFLLEPAGPLHRFPLILLIEHSPRSNLALLTELFRKGLVFPDGLVCAAYSGEAFIGRHDRSWRCEPGNLHAVIHLKPGITPERAGPAFSILMALACAEALPPNPRPRIKWVNDVQVGGKKIGGGLTRQTYQSPHVTDVFLGVGVNVLVDPRIMPNPFVTGSDCLRTSYPGRPWSPGAFLLDLLVRVEHGYGILLEQGGAPLVEAYRAHSEVLGRRVRIFEDGYGFDEHRVQGRKLLAEGVVKTIRDDLSLELEGRADPVPSGRLAYEEDLLL